MFTCVFEQSHTHSNLTPRILQVWMRARSGWEEFVSLRAMRDISSRFMSSSSSSQREMAISRSPAAGSNQVVPPPSSSPTSLLLQADDSPLSPIYPNLSPSLPSLRRHIDLSPIPQHTSSLSSFPSSPLLISSRLHRSPSPYHRFHFTLHPAPSPFLRNLIFFLLKLPRS